MGNYGLQKFNIDQAMENVEADRRRDQQWDRQQALWDRQDKEYKRQQELQRRQDEQYEFEKFRRNFQSLYGNTYNRLLRGQATDEEKTKMLRWLKMDDSIVPAKALKDDVAVRFGVRPEKSPGKGRIGAKPKNAFYSLTGDHTFTFDNDRDMAGAVKGLLQSKDAWSQENSQVYQEWTKPVWHVTNDGKLVKMSKAESKGLREQGEKIVPWGQFEKQEALNKYKRGNRKYSLTADNRLVPDENGKTISEWGDILNIRKAGVELETAGLKQQEIRKALSAVETERLDIYAYDSAGNVVAQRVVRGGKPTWVALKSGIELTRDDFDNMDLTVSGAPEKGPPQKQGPDLAALKKKADAARDHFKESVELLTGQGLSDDIETFFKNLSSKFTRGQEPSVEESRSATTILQDLMDDQTADDIVRDQAKEALRSLGNYNFYVRQMANDRPVISVLDLPFRPGGPEVPTRKQEAAYLAHPFWDDGRRALPLSPKLDMPISSLPAKFRGPDVLTPEEEALVLKRDPLFAGYRYSDQGPGLNPVQARNQSTAPAPDYIFSGDALHPVPPANQGQSSNRGLLPGDAPYLFVSPSAR